VIVIVVVAVAPVGVSADGENAQDAPEGNPEQLKLTVALNPPRAVSVMVSVPLDPAVTLREGLAAAIWKSELLSANVAVDVVFAAVAVMLYELVTSLAVAVTVAIPDAFVVAEVEESVALAPVAGAVYVTVAPETGAPAASTTSVESAVVNAVPIRVFCPLPPLALRVVVAQPELAGTCEDFEETCPLPSAARATTLIVPLPATGTVNGRLMSGTDV